MNIAVIPVKSHSTRLPGKNLRMLGDRPLWRWTFDAALGCVPIDRIIITTDSDAVSDEATDWNMGMVDVVMRPPELCRDPAQIHEVAVHAVRQHSDISYQDTIVTLLCTSPFRTAEQIDAAIRLHETSGRANVLSCCITRDDKACAITPSSGVLSRSRVQHAALNGAIWIATTERLLADGGYTTDDAVPYVMDAVTGLDIDTPQEWAMAEHIANAGAWAGVP